MKISGPRIDSSVLPVTNTVNYPAQGTNLVGSQSPAVNSSTVAALSSSAPQSAANRPQVATIEASPSTTVAGKSYPESIAESAGVYIASVPNPPGARAMGSSVQDAERNLQIKLDALA